MSPEPMLEIRRPAGVFITIERGDILQTTASRSRMAASLRSMWCGIPTSSGTWPTPCMDDFGSLLHCVHSPVSWDRSLATSLAGGRRMRRCRASAFRRGVPNYGFGFGTGQLIAINPLLALPCISNRTVLPSLSVSSAKVLPAVGCIAGTRMAP